MRFDDSPVKISTNHNEIVAFDPGAKFVGMVSVNTNDFDPTCNGFTRVKSWTFSVDELIKRESDDMFSSVQIFEAPFFKTNPSTLGHTWMCIGHLWNPYAEHIFVTPQMGNKILGLDKASTVDLAKMNMAQERGWDFKTPHEVSAMAALLAAIEIGKLVIE